MTNEMFMSIAKLKNKMEEYERFLRVMKSDDAVINVSGNVSYLYLPPCHEEERIDLKEDPELADLLLKQLVLRLENIKHEFNEI